MIYASETGGNVVRQGQELRTFKLQAALNRLVPGDILKLLETSKNLARSAV